MIKDNLEKGVSLILVTDSWRIGFGGFHLEIRQDPIPKNDNDQKRETGPKFGPTFYVLYLREWHACEFFTSFLSQIFCYGTH